MYSVTNLTGVKKKKYWQLGFRVTDAEKARFDELVVLVRERARYEISETDILKTLVGFRDLAHLTDSDKKLLKEHPEHKHHRKKA